MMDSAGMLDLAKWTKHFVQFMAVHRSKIRLSLIRGEPYSDLFLGKELSGKFRNEHPAMMPPIYRTDQRSTRMVLISKGRKVSFTFPFTTGSSSCFSSSMLVAQTRFAPFRFRMQLEVFRSASYRRST